MRPTDHEVLNGGSGPKVGQPALKLLGHADTQFTLCYGLALAKLAERLCGKCELQGCNNIQVSVRNKVNISSVK